jgi:two-component system, chemotaxis family, chemotaxis protein CheY
MPRPVILIIDDDREIVRLAEFVLKAKGYKIEVAFDARQGMAQAFSSPPDLILLDNRMPGRDGLALLKDIRALPDLERVPVIMLTGSSDPEIVSNAIQQRVNDFIVKPFDINMLVERVARLVPPPADLI